MKRFLKHSIVFSVLFSSIVHGSVFAQYFTEPTFTIMNMQVDDSGLIGTYSDNKASVKLTAVLSESQTASTTISFDCLPGGNLIDYKYVKLTSQTKSPSYILIENTSEDVGLTRVEFIGYGQGSSTKANTICGVSLDGLDYDLYSDEDTDFPVGKVISFNVSDFQASCDDVESFTSLDLPVRAYDLEGNEYDGFQKKAKYIRLNWMAGEFAGLGVTQKGAFPEIYGIKIYTDQKTSTGVGEDEGAIGSDVVLKGSLLQVSQRSEISLYSVAGKLLTQEWVTDVLDLQKYDNGIYIVKAVNTINGHICVKKISLIKQ